MVKKIFLSFLLILTFLAANPSVYAANHTTTQTENVKPLASKYVTVTDKYFGVYPEEINYEDAQGYQGTLHFTKAIDAGGGWWLVTYGGFVRQN
ncbi:MULTISPECIES: hypothetical protein [Brevibacillus]|jgi:hypothetical protein|uniref:hypothetical protein n=1 Tax=Brevibacillus TaxID=55080 RepID=UPI00156BA828|nr:MULTISPECIES: hypothetical protein [Brevibacillus]MDR4998866.1 hypothetical protein [Brevibacillus parabrevis]UED67508.1 hypothetical protein HP435_19720 [Brevibacillus sp. HD3.3A]WDV93758.1 hypothetical protein PSE45_19145 [Brevibacillus parabrevis]